MIKRIFLILMLLCSNAFAQEAYNSIATAYVTTTISQDVVFNSTMQQGGTFNFSVLAHNGGGRAGQSDTANVKIQFYNSSGGLVTSVNSTNSANLPNPNAVCGNPCIDPAVPWTKVEISATLNSTQASQVVYAKISMYGIDGSYWAGDYGPWYRAPTFTLNNGNNLAYNPEFGPYNNVTAQGWVSSPGFGACQGAWGGSNACIVNSSGVPGTSTTGLVANANGGGPSATGGTTSGQPGGYNSTMSTTNPTGAPPPPATSSPTFSQLKFSRNQIADTQWNVGSCTNAGGTNCQIYSKAPGPTWNTGSPVYPTSTQYIQFTATGDAANPWHMYLYNADGTVAQDLGVGHILSEGLGTDGHHYFFFANDNYNGTLFSTDWGMNNSDGLTINGTNNPTVPQTDTFAASGSTTPLDAGATGGGSSTPPAPTVTGTSTTNSVSTSSSSTNTSSVTVTRPTSTGGYSDVYVGTTTVTTTTTTPVTTTTWSDGSTTTSNGTPTATSATTYTITPTYGTAPIYTQTAPNTSGNSVYVKQVYAWANTQVSITQEGNNNAVTGINNGWATVDGNGSIISTKQYGQGNIIGLKMNAWGNNVDIKQQAANGGDVNNNILMFDSYGNGNASTVQQQSNSNTASIKMTYDINTVNVTQKTGTGNQSYATVSGYWNTVNTTQNGTDNFSLINISGDNNTATVNQTGTGHNTLLNLIGNKNTVSVIQTGTGDAYSLQQTCTNPAGCSVSVIRNK
jgi:hypothetical protein